MQGSFVRQKERRLYCQESRVCISKAPPPLLGFQNVPAFSVRRERRGTQSRSNSERHKSEKSVPLLRGKEMTGGDRDEKGEYS